MPLGQCDTTETIEAYTVLPNACYAASSGCTRSPITQSPNSIYRPRAVLTPRRPSHYGRPSVS